MAKKNLGGDRLSLALVGLIVIFLDQLSKYFARSFLSFDKLTLLPSIELVLVKNKGILFGLLYDGALNLVWILVGFCAVIAVLYIYNEYRNDWFWFALVIGGTLSNILDRIFFGFVTDFIKLGFWPVFNIADSAVTIGVIIILLKSALNKHKV